LERGQAYFEVFHDPSRPFTVAAGDSTVTALGTVFAVRRDSEAVTVTLVSGRVTVSEAPNPGASGSNLGVTLNAGEQVAVTHARFTPARPVDTARATNWTKGDIVFRETPLGQAVNEINRYTDTKLAVRDPSMEALPINGVFHVADVESFLLALDASFGV